MCEEIIILFEKYQTFIVGILGFSGVIFTIIMNARLSMRQHVRQVNHEKTSVRTAICTELELIHKIFKDRCKSNTTDGGLQSAFFPECIPNKVYMNLANKIGLLSSHEIESIIEAYVLIDEIPIRLRLLSTDHDPSFDKLGYIYISSKQIERAIGIHESFLPKIDLAIKALKDNIRAEQVKAK